MKNIFISLIIFGVSATPTTFIDLDKLCRQRLFSPVSHPEDPNKFIGCAHGVGTVMSCKQLDQVFDPVLEDCVKDDSLTLPSYELLCEDEIVDTVFPVEFDCTRYIACKMSQPQVKQCPQNHIFNPRLPGCVVGDKIECSFYEPGQFYEAANDYGDESGESSGDSSGEYSGESEITTTTTSPTTSQPGDINISFVCPVAGFGNIPHNTDCGRYFECIQGIRFARTCPSGYIFDIISRTCGQPIKSLCANIIRCV